jgi:hypothetical protein
VVGARLVVGGLVAGVVEVVAESTAVTATSVLLDATVAADEPPPVDEQPATSKAIAQAATMEFLRAKPFTLVPFSLTGLEAASRLRSDPSVDQTMRE